MLGSSAPPSSLTLFRKSLTSFTRFSRFQLIASLRYNDLANTTSIVSRWALLLGNMDTILCLTRGHTHTRSYTCVIPELSFAHVVSSLTAKRNTLRRREWRARLRFLSTAVSSTRSPMCSFPFTRWCAPPKLGQGGVGKFFFWKNIVMVVLSVHMHNVVGVVAVWVGISTSRRTLRRATTMDALRCGMRTQARTSHSLTSTRSARGVLILRAVSRLAWPLAVTIAKVCRFILICFSRHNTQ